VCVSPSPARLLYHLFYILSVIIKIVESSGKSKRNPVQVKVYDFLSEAQGKAIPYGVYNIINNKGWVVWN
jgi:hypothetical protein